MNYIYSKIGELNGSRKKGQEMKELGFEDAQRKSGDKRYWVWLGLRWKNENTSGGESEYVEF